MKLYSFRRSRRTLHTAFKLFKKKGKKLSKTNQQQFEADLRALDKALLSKKREEASTKAKEVEAFVKTHFPKTTWDYSREVIYAVIFAIVVAFCIRQFWFELYQVPTGSMRPTVEELDRMVVSKSTFGLHVPFVDKQLFFSPDYILRAGNIVFTVKDMDIPDPDMLYFGIIPGKKRFIKRCMAKPGDTVYFYGGRIYGIDREGNPVMELADEKWLEKYGIEKIDHVPYISMDGKMQLASLLSQNVWGSATLLQMNIPVGKLQLQPSGKIEGVFFNGKKWVKDRPNALKVPHDQPKSYSDLWGIGNYAMARLLTEEEVELFYNEVPKSEEALLYLELRHTPNLTFPKPEIRRDEYGRYHPMITPFTTLVPLNRSHLDALQKALYTSRFIVEDGRAYLYQEGNGRGQRPEFDPTFPGVSNGCYEFYYGKGYRVHLSGVRTKLSPDDPLYDSSPENIRKLFNLGIRFNTVYSPYELNQTYYPERFAYYRDGDLYVMGAPILKKEDPSLARFVESELKKQENSSSLEPYIAFIDPGPPLKEGKLDVDFIRSFGLKVPEEGTLALGDNFARSADSRDFGWVPTNNLRGAASFIFWPPTSHLGPLSGPPYPWITLPNLLVWSLVLIIVIVCILYIRKRNRTSLF
ncbi:MAG: signal peptidase I [Chlamydiales bacterium]